MGVVRSQQAANELEAGERRVAGPQPGDTALLADASAHCNIVAAVGHLERPRWVAKPRSGAVKCGRVDKRCVRPCHAGRQRPTAAGHLTHQPEGPLGGREERDGAILGEANRAGVAVGEGKAARGGLVLDGPAEQVLGRQVAPARIADCVWITNTASVVGKDVPGLGGGLVAGTGGIVVVLDRVVPAGCAARTGERSRCSRGRCCKGSVCWALMRQLLARQRAVENERTLGTMPLRPWLTAEAEVLGQRAPKRAVRGPTLPAASPIG